MLRDDKPIRKHFWVDDMKILPISLPFSKIRRSAEFVRS
jgi:hypothetical protein